MGQLKAELRQLRGIAPPGRLQETLMAAVPVPVADRAGPPAVSRWFKAIRYVGAAAVIVIAASVALQHLTPSSGPPRIVADINDRSGSPALVDHNQPLPRDINVCDNNAVP